VFEDETEKNMIEMRVVKGKLEYIGLVELDIAVAGGLNAPASLFERDPGNVDGHDVRGTVARGEKNGLSSGAAAAFEN